MSKGNNWENGILELALNNVTFAGLGDATGPHVIQPTRDRRTIPDTLAVIPVI